MTHHDFKDDDGELLELYAVKNHFKVEMEEDPDYFFDEVTKDDTEQPEEEVLPQVIDAEVMGVNDGGPQNLAVALNGVVDIDDINDPAPENIPTPGVNTNSVLSSEWGHAGICYRQQQSNPNSKAKLSDPVDVTLNNIYVQLFERFFPKQYVNDVILPSTNKKLKQQLTYGEFLRWLGLWILMLTRDRSDQCSFWS